MTTTAVSHHEPWIVVSCHAIFQADVTKIWPLLADFRTLSTLVPDVDSCDLTGEGVGSSRQLHFKDGKTVEELVIVNHPELFRMSYSMRDPNPFPWKHYFCSQQLQSLGAGRTHFLYTGYCHAEGGTEAEIRESLEGFYHAVFDGVASVLDAKVTVLA